MDYTALLKRGLVTALSTGMVILQVPAVGATGSVFGTMKGSGAAWVAADSTEWAEVSSTRPLLAGDRIKTGESGYVLADLGSHGVIGLSPEAEVSATGTADAAVFEVQKGKVAFHLNDNSSVRVAAAGASVKAAGDSDGYIEMGSGAPTLTVERGAMQVAMAAGQRTVTAGQSVKLDATEIAGAYGEPQQPEEVPAPPPAPAPVQEEENKKRSLAPWILGATAIAAVAVGVGVGVGGDNNNCPHNED